MPLRQWSHNAIERIGRAITWVERQPRFRREPRARWHRHPQSDSTVRCCLAEDHPGYNIVFNVFPGTWNPAIDNWDYSTETAPAKDLFFADPEILPGEGATGMFIPRPSDEHGTIYMAISGDCDSPGPCHGTGS